MGEGGGSSSWRRMPTQVGVALLWVAVWAAVPVTCAPHPDSSDNDTPTRDNALEMLVITPRASPLPSIVVVTGGSSAGSSEDLVNYYLPVIMAEMAAPVSTRDPSIIRVSCRQGFHEDPVGGCRPVFNPTPYFPHSPRPNRHTSVASILPSIRSPSRIPRPEVQTQRELIRQFNISRRPSWFGRSLTEPKGPESSKTPSSRLEQVLMPMPVTTTTTSTTTTTPTTTPSTITPSTTTLDCDD
ncbi:uncharacterized protein [Cherax quadricarinatus]|nr:uncharacterized protein LOC128699319 [Cherax quadricarinatus]